MWWVEIFSSDLCNIFFPPSLSPIQWFVFINFRQSRDVRVWNVGNKDFLNIGTVTRFDVWLLLLVGSSREDTCGNRKNSWSKPTKMTTYLIENTSFIFVALYTVLQIYPVAFVCSSQKFYSRNKSLDFRDLKTFKTWKILIFGQFQGMENMIWHDLRCQK